MKKMRRDELKKMGLSGQEYYKNNFEREFLLNRLINIFNEVRNT